MLITYLNKHDQYRFRVSPHGMTLNSIVDKYLKIQDTKYEWVIPNKREYAFFREFVMNYLINMQEYDPTAEKRSKETDLYVLSNTEAMTRIVSGNITMMRNLEDYPFLASGEADTAKLEEIIVDTLNQLKFKTGEYSRDLSELDEVNSTYLSSDSEVEHFLGARVEERGFFQFHKCEMVAIVNDIDHLKFSTTFYDEIMPAFEDITSVINDFETHLKFSYDRTFGFLTASPKFLGTGTSIEVTLKANAIAHDEIKKKAANYQCEFDYEGEYLKIWNKSTIGVSPSKIVENIINMIVEVDNLDQ